MNFEDCLKEFHDIINDNYPDKPTVPSIKDLIQRRELIQEEFDEFLDAFYQQKPLEDQAKEITDLLYVVLGTMIKMGLPVDECFYEVHASNMTKQDGYLDGNGKWIKPDNYVPADMKWIVE